jgi:hypothetical protein
MRTVRITRESTVAVAAIRLPRFAPLARPPLGAEVPAASRRTNGTAAVAPPPDRRTSAPPGTHVSAPETAKERNPWRCAVTPRARPDGGDDDEDDGEEVHDASMAWNRGAPARLADGSRGAWTGGGAAGRDAGRLRRGGGRLDLDGGGRAAGAGRRAGPSIRRPWRTAATGSTTTATAPPTRPTLGACASRNRCATRSPRIRTATATIPF